MGMAQAALARYGVPNVFHYKRQCLEGHFL